MTTPVSPGAASTVAEWLVGIMSSVLRREEAIRRAASLYERDATSSTDRAAAHVRLGDLFDALAAELSSAPLPPISMVFAPPRAPPSANEVERAQSLSDRSLRQAMEGTVVRFYCLALSEYLAALALDLDDTRASEQRAGYGEAFEVQCREVEVAGED